VIEKDFGYQLVVKAAFIISLQGIDGIERLMVFSNPPGAFSCRTGSFRYHFARLRVLLVGVLG
jgi:hypothetical protein